MTLAQLPNLGPTIVGRLVEAGIEDVDNLKRVGPAAAYQRLVRAAGRTLPVCYYLYALEGALSSRDWRSLDDEEKLSLRASAGLE